MSVDRRAEQILAWGFVIFVAAILIGVIRACVEMP
jgi:hypothetical protein